MLTTTSAPQNVPSEEDPQSELNVLRREVRQLQAAVRDSTLQVAANQDELITLRQALCAAENQIEEGLSREENLREQVQVQRLKKERVEATLSAAEALVDALREMLLEADTPQRTSASSAPTSPVCYRPVRAPPSPLDVVLSRISDTSNQPFVESSPLPLSISQPAHPAHPTYPSPSYLNDHIPNEGSTTSPPSSHASSAYAAHLPSEQPPSSNPLHRHSMPHISATSTNPIHSPIPPSNLLLSAFGFNSTAPTEASAVRSSAVHSDHPLPTEVATVGKSDKLLHCNSISQPLPSCVRSSVTDAHSGEIYALTSSSDARWIASGGDDKCVRIFDATSSASCASISENSRSVTAIAFHPHTSSQTSDCPLLHLACSDGTVKTMRRNPRRKSKWTLRAIAPVHTQPVRRLLFVDSHGLEASPNLMLSCSTDRSIKLSDIESGRRPFVPITPSPVLDVACLRPGVLVSGHKDGGIRLWSMRDQNTTISASKVHTKGVVSVSCLDDGFGVVSLGRDNVMRVSETRMGLSVLREIEDRVETVSDWHRAAVNGRHVVCGTGSSGHVGIWNVDTGKLIRRVSSKPSKYDVDVLDMVGQKLRNPGCVVIPHWTTSNQLVCAHRNRQISFWDCE